METQKNNPVGSINIAPDVILKIAETAAKEVGGIAAPEPSAKPGMFCRRPVRAKLNGGSAAIDMDIVVLEGFNAVKVAEKVQRSVKAAVQGMTGLTVAKVDVNIAGIQFKEEHSSRGAYLYYGRVTYKA